MTSQVAPNRRVIPAMRSRAPFRPRATCHVRERRPFTREKGKKHALIPGFGTLSVPAEIDFFRARHETQSRRRAEIRIPPSGQPIPPFAAEKQTTASERMPTMDECFPAYESKMKVRDALIHPLLARGSDCATKGDKQCWCSGHVRERAGRLQASSQYSLLQPVRHSCALAPPTTRSCHFS